LFASCLRILKALLADAPNVFHVLCKPFHYQQLQQLTKTFPATSHMHLSEQTDFCFSKQEICKMFTSKTETQVRVKQL